MMSKREPEEIKGPDGPLGVILVIIGAFAFLGSMLGAFLFAAIVFVRLAIWIFS